MCSGLPRSRGLTFLTVATVAYLLLVAFGNFHGKLRWGWFGSNLSPKIVLGRYLGRSTSLPQRCILKVPPLRRKNTAYLSPLQTRLVV